MTAQQNTDQRYTIISLFLHFSLVSPYFVTLVITATHTQCLLAPPGRLDSLRPTEAKGNHNHDQKWLSSFFHVFNRLIINNVNKIAAELFKKIQIYVYYKISINPHLFLSLPIAHTRRHLNSN